MKLFLTLLLFLILYKGAGAQENYDVSLISKDLLPYASAVVRNKEVNVEVKSLDNTYYHIKTAITILNKNADDIAHIGVWFDKSRVIKSIKGVVYNQFGKPVSKFSESDFEDQNWGAQSSLFDDTKIRHFNPAITDYPYTIVYEYEVKSKQTLFFDDWEANDDAGVAVEKSSYTFSCKPDFKIRYKEINMPGKVVIATNKQGEDTYTWQVNNLKAIKEEPYSPSADKYLSKVKVSPVKFQYLGTSGSFSNWNEMGKWINDNLLASRRTISPVTAARMKQLTEGIADPKLKAKKIYEYMQSKTHYISVQVGIGGFQPFLADDVDQQNYGDCKALVNYTQALLKAVDIDSYYCIVKSGRLKKSPLVDFASMNQFDHVILCLPFKNDTTFLECTSQKIPFGFLSDFTDDRYVLACTPTGGKLLHTPKYTAQYNLQQCKASFVLDTTGKISGQMNTEFKGTQYDNREYIIEEAPAEQVKSLQREYAINNMEIEKFAFQQDKSLQPVTIETIKLDAPDYGSVNGKKIIFLPNTGNRIEHIPREVRNRHFEMYINTGYTDDDEITFTLPAGYHVDMRPEATTINKPFGKFSVSATVEGNKLKYKRKLQVIDGYYNKELYAELVAFYQSVWESDSSNITLIKDN
jgi:transglutaminase-like putative cysteine protease